MSVDMRLGIVNLPENSALFEFRQKYEAIDSVILNITNAYGTLFEKQKALFPEQEAINPIQSLRLTLITLIDPLRRLHVNSTHELQEEAIASVIFNIINIHETLFEKQKALFPEQKAISPILSLALTLTTIIDQLRALHENVTHELPNVIHELQEKNAKIKKK